MKAVVFRGVDDLVVDEVPKPRAGAGEAVIRITATTICGTDVHIVRGEYAVRAGLILGHEPVGVIEELGAGLGDEYSVGQRVIVGAITPCGQCFYCLNAVHSQCHEPLLTHRFALDDLPEAYDLFSHQRDGVLKVAIYPGGEKPGGGRTRASA